MRLFLSLAVMLAGVTSVEACGGGAARAGVVRHAVGKLFHRHRAASTSFVAVGQCSPGFVAVPAQVVPQPMPQVAPKVETSAPKKTTTTTTTVVTEDLPARVVAAPVVRVAYTAAPPVYVRSVPTGTQVTRSRSFTRSFTGVGSTATPVRNLFLGGCPNGQCPSR